MLRPWACLPPQRKEEGHQTHPGGVAAVNHPALNSQIPGSCCSLAAGTGSPRPGDRTLFAALGQGQAESDRKSRERKGNSEKQLEQRGRRSGRAEERRTRGQLGQRAVVGTGGDPRSHWPRRAPSPACNLRAHGPPPPPSRPPLLRPAPAQSPKRCRGRCLHCRSRSCCSPGHAWRRTQVDRPSPSLPVTPQPPLDRFTRSTVPAGTFTAP